MARTFWYGLVVVVVTLGAGAALLLRGNRETPAPAAAGEPAKAAGVAIGEAGALIQSGRYREAVDLLVRALKTNRDPGAVADLHLHLAIAYAKKAETSSSIDDVRQVTNHLKEALAANPKHVPALKAMAFVRRHLGENAEAISCYEKALDLEPNDPGSWQELAVLKAKTGDTKGADYAREQARTRTAPR